MIGSSFQVWSWTRLARSVVAMALTRKPVRQDCSPDGAQRKASAASGSCAVGRAERLLRSSDLRRRCARSPRGRLIDINTAWASLRSAHPTGVLHRQDGEKLAIFFDSVPASFQSTRVPPRSEASSGDNQRAEAGAAPAGGVTDRTRATTGHYDPDAVGAAAVERRKASAPIARGTGTPRKRPSAWLAPTPRCGSHPHRAPFRRSAASLEGDSKRRHPVRQRVEKSTPGISAALAV